MSGEVLFMLVVLACLAGAVLVYRRAVATGTPRLSAFYMALLLGPLALPLLLGTRK